MENWILYKIYFDSFKEGYTITEDSLLLESNVSTNFNIKKLNSQLNNGLIFAPDMFLLGTAMLTFGMGLYVMFVGSRSKIKGDHQLSGKNLFYFQTLPSLMGMKSVMQAKSRIGHALVMLLQVGVLEKFKNVPVVNGLDLAYFAGSVFVSSICVFILSRIPLTTTKANN